MSVNSKKQLSQLVYYTLICLTLAMSAFFIYCLAVKDVALWAKIIYFVWIGLVIGVTIFDVVCTSTSEGKKVSGLIIYVLSILAVVMAGLLYFLNVGPEGLATEFLSLFISISLISLMTTGYMIASWCVGESLVEYANVDEEIRNN